MRLVFSRKGFDTKYGMSASPIMPNGTMLSLPIPERGSGQRYADLRTADGSSYLSLMNELGIKGYDNASEAHHDPDIVYESMARHADWRPVFGQCSGPQTELSRNAVREGDLFLFFGNFRHTKISEGRLRFVGQWLHVLFAYLRIGSVVSVDSKTNLPWCAEHPHLVNRNRANNTLYMASELLGTSGLPGAGMLRFSEELVLTNSGETASRWRMPRFFHPEVGGRMIGHHKPTAWRLDESHAYLQTKSPGQEYVIEASTEMLPHRAAS